MDGNRRDSVCRPFFAHTVIRNLSGGRLVFTDECIFLILVDSIIEIITEKG